MEQQSREPFALAVRFTIRGGAEEEFDGLVQDTVALIQANEPGTLVYATHRVAGAPRQRVFYELYVDRAAFEAHEAQPHVRRFLRDREPLLEETQVDVLEGASGVVPTSGDAR